MRSSRRHYPLRLLLLTSLTSATPVILCAQAAATGSPPAPAPTIGSLAWLAGSWQGTVNGGRLSADLMFSQPHAGVIVGAVRITQGSDLAVIKLISLLDTPRGIELRFRHFGGDLRAYESDFKQNMTLSAVSDTDVTFTNQVAYDPKQMSTQPRVTRFIRRGPDQFVGHSDIIGDDGKPAVIESVYQRVP